MKWKLTVLGVFIGLNCFCQIEIKSIDQAKELLVGKWNLYEYCVYEANYCKKDSSSSIIFSSIIEEDKLNYTLFEKGAVKKKGVVSIYDFIKVRTSDKYTLDNFLFSSSDALIVSFLDLNSLCLLQNSYQGFAKHYKRDKAYKAQDTIINSSESER